MATDHAYALDGNIPVKFETEGARNRWVKAGDLLPRNEVDTDAHRIQQYETLVEYGLARWRWEHDPHLDLDFALADFVIPAPVTPLPPQQAKAYWLCDHEDGPGLTQREAADLLGMSSGSLYNLLEDARDKLGER